MSDASGWQALQYIAWVAAVLAREIGADASFSLGEGGLKVQTDVVIHVNRCDSHVVSQLAGG